MCALIANSQGGKKNGGTFSGREFMFRPPSEEAVEEARADQSLSVARVGALFGVPAKPEPSTG